MPSRSLERERFYLFMLSDALSSIGYWADVREITSAADDITSYEVIETGDGDEPPRNLGRVDIESIAKGWQLLVKLETSGGFTHCGNDRGVRHNEKELAKGEWGDTDYDGCMCDAVIQLATMGKVVYG